MTVATIDPARLLLAVREVFPVAGDGVPRFMARGEYSLYVPSMSSADGS